MAHFTLFFALEPTIFLPVVHKSAAGLAWCSLHLASVHRRCLLPPMHAHWPSSMALLPPSADAHHVLLIMHTIPCHVNAVQMVPRHLV